MKVCVHALRLADVGGRKLGGNFFHVFRLVEALSRRPDVDLFVLADCMSATEFERILPARRIICRGGNGTRLVPAEIAAFTTCRMLRPDIFHRPIGQLPMLPLHGKLVMGVADLNFRDVGASAPKRVYKEVSYQSSIARSAAIVCISEFTRVRLTQCFPQSASKAEVIHHGAEGLKSEPEPVSGLEPHRFWLCFAHRPNKNLEASLSAYASYLQDAERDGQCAKLVVIGDNDYSRSVLMHGARCEAVRKNITVLEYVSEGALVWLYRNALGLLFPSRYEGFGLPIVEAMSSGCPVIAGDIPPLHEVGGDAAVYCGVDDSAALAKHMQLVQCNDSFRAQLIHRGRERVRQFSWDHAAARTVALYRRILGVRE